ncbi:unnamed protein product [Alopecurus aequalis]
MTKALFDAASVDDLARFKELVTELDDGRGRPKEAIEVLRSGDVDLQGLGLLHVAASKGSLEVCGYLVEVLHFDVNDAETEGRTPLLCAILGKSVSTSQYLLTHGADPNKSNSDGISALHSAAGSGDTELVELLLLNGAYVDQVASCGTALHCAVTQDHSSTVKVLLDHDADCSIMVNLKTPLKAAFDVGAKNCMLLLSKAEAFKVVSKGSGHTKKRPLKDTHQDNPDLDSHIFSQSYGDFSEEIFQRQQTVKRQRAQLSQLLPEASGATFVVQGFAQSISKRGKNLVLLVLRDAPHTVKCIVSTDTVGVSDGMIAYVAKIERESYVEVHGEVQLNKHSQVELNVRKLYCITRSLAKLPFLLDDASRGEHVEFDKNLKRLAHVKLNIRLNKRFLDLRTNPTHSIFQIQSAVTLKFTEIFGSSGFVSMHSPKLTSETSSEGGAEVFKVPYPNGATAALAQSPQLYKQMAINGGLKRVFEIAPVYRAEKSRTRRHLTEYIGLHMEMEINEHYMEVCHFVGSIFVMVFDHLKEKYQKEIDVIKEQYPCENMKYLAETLMLKYADGIQMLKDSGFKIEVFEDLNNEAEKELGRLVLDKFGTDFFILYEYSNSFDAFIRGEEVLSGSQRIHDQLLLLERIIECGLDAESFEWFIETFRYGAPPRGGFGAGLERFVMLYLGLPDIKMASMFPRDVQRLKP